MTRALLLTGLLMAVTPAFGQDAPTATPCPFDTVGRDIRASLLYDRALVDLDPTDVQVREGVGLTGMDPHAVVPQSFWRQVVVWGGDRGQAILLVDDPVLTTPTDLLAAAKLSISQRVGTDKAESAVPVVVAFREPGVGGQVMTAMYDEATWTAGGVVTLPDGSMLNVAVGLYGDLSNNASCRAAALGRLASIGPGPRPRDLGVSPAPLPLGVGGALNLPVPDGYAPIAFVGWEASIASVVAWAPAEEEEHRPALAFRVSHLAWPESPTKFGKPVARGAILGVKARWTRSTVAPDEEDTWITGMFGEDWKGDIRVTVRAPTKKERARLRKLAEAVTFTRSEESGSAE